MDPLIVARGVGELVDALLIDGDPTRDPELATDELPTVSNVYPSGVATRLLLFSISSIVKRGRRPYSVQEQVRGEFAALRVGAVAVEVGDALFG